MLVPTREKNFAREKLSVLQLSQKRNIFASRKRLFSSSLRFNELSHEKSKGKKEFLSENKKIYKLRVENISEVKNCVKRSFMVIRNLFIRLRIIWISDQIVGIVCTKDFSVKNLPMTQSNVTFLSFAMSRFPSNSQESFCKSRAAAKGLGDF